MVVFFLTRTNRSNLKANKTDLYEVISKKLKKLGKFVDLSLKRFPSSTKYHKRFQSSLIRKVLCAVSKNCSFLPSFLFFSHRFLELIMMHRDDVLRAVESVFEGNFCTARV